MGKWNRHLFHPGLPLGEDGRRVTSSKAHTELARRGAAEGMVLLKNDNNVLPLKRGCRVALFGKATIDYVRGGGGSGFVNVSYQTNLYQGLKIKESEGKISVFEPLAKYYIEYVEKQYSMGNDPGMIEEADLPINLLEDAKKYTDTAIISISRFSGEGWDRKPSTEKDEALWEDQEKFGNRQAELFPNSDYKITKRERKMIDSVLSSFKNVIVVINSGGIIETGWIKNDTKISSAIFSWQGGIEGGLATADLLVGDETPSARLVDTFADALEDYPSTYNFHDSLDYVEYTDDIYVGYRYFETIPNACDKVIYPFGHGLSYTTFNKELISFDILSDKIYARVKVTNTGNTAGKEVVLLYYSAPNGVLGKPSVELAAFNKTKKLEKGESVELVLKVQLQCFYLLIQLSQSFYKHESFLLLTRRYKLSLIILKLYDLKFLSPIFVFTMLFPLNK